MITKKENKPSLRPVDYTREIRSTICDRLFDGETLSEICRDAAMPVVTKTDALVRTRPFA